MLSDDYSDLTELDSDDYETKNKGGKSKKGVKGVYKIRNALKVPRATTYTALALFDQIHSNDINLEPEYQRDVVWSESKQIGLIDSIFRNFYIPPIIFAVNTYDDGSETKTCIDGKQRLTSIHKFMEGLIPHKDPYTNERYYYKEPASVRGARIHNLLPERYRTLFANKQIVCVEYEGINDSDEREIFQRVQLGMALTPAEKLQVIKTDRSDFMRELQEEHMRDEGWLSSNSLEWDTSRGSDYRSIAQAVYIMFRYPTTPTGPLPSISTPALEKWLAANDVPLTEKFKDQVRDTYRVFADMVQHATHSKVFKKPAKLSPIEFICIGVFFYVHKDKASLAQLAAGIARMRANVRELHLDIRMNTRVAKTMLEFVRTWKLVNVPDDNEGPAGGRRRTGGKGKRKRRLNGDDEDDDDENGDNGGDDDDDDDDPPEPKKTKASKSKSPTKKKKSPDDMVVDEPPPIPLPAEAITSATASASTPKSSLPTRFSSSTTSTNITTDRMAALRLAKEAVFQNQSRPTAGASGSTTPSMTRAQALASNPQMLPSPGQTFAQVPATAPVRSPNSSLERTLLLKNVQGQGQGGAVAASSAAGVSESGHRSWDKDREWERGRRYSRDHDDNYRRGSTSRRETPR